MVLDGGGYAGPLYSRLRDDGELGAVPVVVSVEPDQLGISQEMLHVHELIVSPFTSAELSARIARARRAVHGIEENELLKFLMTHPHRAFSREVLLTRVWGYDFFGGARTIDVHVRRVRVKIGPRHASRLSTVRRVGYRWEP